MLFRSTASQQRMPDVGCSSLLPNSNSVEDGLKKYGTLAMSKEKMKNSILQENPEATKAVLNEDAPDAYACRVVESPPPSPGD